MPISPIWPAATAVNAEGSIEFHGRTAESLLDEFGSPLYLIDTDEVVACARHFVRAAAEAFNTSTTHVSFAGKAFLSKEVVRLVTEAGMFVDTCTMGEMKIALAAGVPGRRLVLHGNNKSDEEIALAIEQGFAKIVIDEPDEPERVAAIARKLGKRARVMLRVTVGVHAGGHEYISTAHEDQKFGVPLLAAGADAAVLDVLNDLKDVTPAATNARISATHSPENGAEKTEKSERELHYDVKYPYDLSHEEVSDTDKALAAAMEAIARRAILSRRMRPAWDHALLRALSMSRAMKTSGKKFGLRMSASTTLRRRCFWCRQSRLLRLRRDRGETLCVFALAAADPHSFRHYVFVLCDDASGRQ